MRAHKSPNALIMFDTHKHILFAFQIPGSSAVGLQSQLRTLVYAPSTSPLGFLPGSLKCFEYIKQLQSKGFKEAQAASIVELVSSGREHDLTHLATKADLSETRSTLKSDIANLRNELKEEIASLRTELKGDTASLRTELKGDIASLRSELKDVKFDILKWLIPFFIGLMLEIWFKG